MFPTLSNKRIGFSFTSISKNLVVTLSDPEDEGSQVLNLSTTDRGVYRVDVLQQKFTVDPQDLKLAVEELSQFDKNIRQGITGGLVITNPTYKQPLSGPDDSTLISDHYNEDDHTTS